MKKIVPLLVFALLGLTLTAQETVDLSMGSNYTDRVFFKLSDTSHENFVNNEWDVAFYRMDSFTFATRINDGKGIMVYEASNNPTDWASIDIAQAGNWTQLYNSDTDWLVGAFDNGSATYGWGEYNPATHHVEGAVIFVLEYADGTFKKFFIEDFFGGYTFKYATWNGSTWNADETVTINNTTNESNLFNYYSLENNAEVLAEPAFNSWDLVFTKYATDLGGGMMYNVTGVLHHPDLVVAKHDETSGAPDLENLNYLEAINTIGYDWKSYNGSGYDIDSDTGYYVKFENTQIYKIIFTEFEGGSTGNLQFTVNYEGQLGLNDFENGNSFAVFPNPAVNTVDLLFDIKQAGNSPLQVSIYTISGALIMEKSFENHSGFFRKTIDISGLNSGIYMVRASIENQFITKKLVIK